MMVNQDGLQFDGNDPTTHGGSTDELRKQEMRFLSALENLKMVGHAKEKRDLKQAFERVKKGGMSEILFLHGESGIGKSKTAFSLRKQTNKKGGGSAKKRNKQRRGYFVVGKFDQLQRNADPYSAIVDAFSDICDTIDQSLDNANKRQVRDNLLSSLNDDETAILIKVIPKLAQLIGSHQAAAGAADAPGLVQAFIKFKLLCRKFLRAVATESQPIILFLDDLQWADDGSIEVFETLCSDMESKHVLIVGAYRDDEDFKPPNTEVILPCTDIPVPRLGVNDVATIVSQTTDMQIKETLPLAQVVYAKTRGNAQFVKLFLESLYAEKLLSFSLQNLRWEWDVAKLMEETNDASSVLVAAKIDRLSPDVQDVLKFASCLGFYFHVEHLQAIVVAEHEKLTGKPSLPGMKVKTKEFPSSQYRKTLVKLLNKGIKHGVVVEGKRSGTFGFSHDRMFATVYLSLPTGLERQQLHVRIGRLLLATFPMDEIVTFLAVDHVNQGASSIDSTTERLQLVRMNLTTAKRAIDKSAFGRARDYVLAGLSLFSDDLWSMDYDLALDLNTTGASASVMAGFSPERFVDKIVLEGRTLQDKIPAYASLMNFYGWQNKLDDSISAGLELAELLGEKLPKHAGKAHVAWEFVLAKHAIGKLTDEDILSMPVVQDPTKIATIRTMREIGSHAYFRDPNLMIIVSLRALRLTLRYGVYPELSPSAIAAYGFLHTHMNKFDESLRFLNLAVKLTERHKATYIRATVNCVVYGLGLHIRGPIEDAYQPLVDGYLAGEKYGDTGHGLVCGNLACVVKLMTGTPLGEVEKMLDRYIQLMKAYNRNGVFVLTCTFHQRVLNLLGRSKNPTILTGSAMNEDKLYSELKNSGNEVALFMLLDHMFQLNLLFENWVRAKLHHKQLMQHKEALKSLDSHLYMRQFKFFTALLYLVRCRRNDGSRKLKKAAHQILKEMKGRQADGCPNYDCFIPILVAELSSRKLSKVEVNSSFWQAVDGCKYVHLKALAHERAAQMMEERFCDRALAKEHLVSAKRHYSQWEAVAKVRDVEGKLKYL